MNQHGLDAEKAFARNANGGVGGRRPVLPDKTGLSTGYIPTSAANFAAATAAFNTDWYTHANTPQNPHPFQQPSMLPPLAPSPPPPSPVGSHAPAGSSITIHHQATAEAAAQSSQKHLQGLFKCGLIVCATLLFVVLTALLVGMLLNRGSHSDADHGAALSTAGGALVRVAEPSAGIVQDFSDSGQNIHVFYFRFQTGSEIQILERHPELGGIAGMNFSALLDYSVCCTSQTHQFVCMGGAAFSRSGLLLEAYLQKSDISEEVYLLLWVNSKDLVEVGCVMRASFIREDG